MNTTRRGFFRALLGLGAALVLPRLTHANKPTLFSERLDLVPSLETSDAFYYLLSFNYKFRKETTARRYCLRVKLAA